MQKSPFILIAIPLILLITACASGPQRNLTEAELVQNFDAYLQRYQSDLEKMDERSAARIQAEYQNGLADPAVPQSYDVLILSGGGAFGAFGAGFLAGWGEVDDTEYARPEFDTVSGVSTGALIAPFAFLGGDADYRKIIDLYENPGTDWVRRKNIFSIIFGDSSVFDTAKLQAKIEQVVTPGFVHRFDAEAQQNRQLLVGATNADYGQMRVWDLARLTSEMSAQQAIEQFRSVLMASIAIPGAFPPTLIDNNLYVDGGATMQLVSGIDRREWAYFPKAALLEPADLPPIRIRLWIVVNQKLKPEPSLVKLNWAEITTRSASTLIRTSTLQTIADAETYIQLINSFPGFDAQLRYVAIPQDFVATESDTLFDADTMRELIQIGKEMGRNPASWNSQALRPGAPFD